MGCVCNSEVSHGEETNFDCSHITLKFSDTEEPYSPPPQPKRKAQKKSTKRESSPIPSFSNTQKSSESYQPRLYKLIKPVMPYIIAGDLMKYHPGISAQFINRYCVLTDSEFRYYKSQHSYSLGEKPLLNIPVSLVEAVNQ